MEQLLVLYQSGEFSQYRESIRERLCQLNGLKLDLFRTVHVAENCNINEVVTGDKVRVKYGGEDVVEGSKEEDVRKLECIGHGVHSIEFCRTKLGFLREEVLEGPFRRSW